MIVTIAKFQQIQNIIAEHDEDAAEILCVGALHDLTEKQVRDMPIDKFRELKKSLSPAILSTEPQKLVREFIIDGITYKVSTVFEYGGQFIDFSELQKNTITNLHTILALFAKPDGEYYMDNIIVRAQLFKDKCPFEIAQSVAFFFSRLIRELSHSAKTYSQAQGAGGTKRNGVGTRLLMAWRMVTGQNGISFSAWAARNSSTISRK